MTVDGEEGDESDDEGDELEAAGDDGDGGEKVKEISLEVEDTVKLELLIKDGDGMEAPVGGMARVTGRANLDDDDALPGCDEEAVIKTAFPATTATGAAVMAMAQPVGAGATSVRGAGLRGGIGGGMEVKAECGC